VFSATAPMLLRLRPIDVNWKQTITFRWAHAKCSFLFELSETIISSFIENIFVVIVHFVKRENCINQGKESKVSTSRLCDIRLDIKPTANNRNVGGVV
jgi:hypothetical protein